MQQKEMAEEENTTNEKTSKINSGLAQIYRLDFLWKETHKHARAGKFKDWNEDLDRVWCELGGDLLEDNPNHIKLIEEFDSKEKKVMSYGNFNDSPPAGWKKLNEEQIKNRELQYKALIDKELFVRRLQNKLGKGTAFEEGDDYMD